MRMRTSPAFGGATSISTIFSGSPAAKATAARDLRTWPVVDAVMADSFVVI